MINLIKAHSKKNNKKETHEIPIFEKDLNKEVWMALFDFGVPVTFEEDVKKHDDTKEIIYNVRITLTRKEWDKLNRRLGALGINEMTDDEDEEEDD